MLAAALDALILVAWHRAAAGVAVRLLACVSATDPR